MAKMFYSLEEAAQRLGKSAEDVRQMASSGQLQEFRDRDKLMFKREQVDLLAGGAGKGDSGFIPLADNAGSSIGLSLDDSSSASKSGSKGGSGGIDLDEPNPKERSGISIFDTESTEEGDPSAVTRISETRGGADELTLESVGSGSGLLDLTREADDTSLGADLLEDVYKKDEDGGSIGDTQGSSGLFETTTAPSDVGAMAAGAGMATVGMVAAEPYDGSWSGLGGGFALGGVLACAVTLIAVLLGLMGAGNPLVDLVGGNPMILVAALAGATLVFAGVGFVLGRRG
ncbi:MAG: hypothetical protein K2W85_09270 [Phycisphaerales bacterium]|nr:hypothetical protein [Phycisphaerales bacterium]